MNASRVSELFGKCPEIRRIDGGQPLYEHPDNGCIRGGLQQQWLEFAVEKLGGILVVGRHPLDQLVHGFLHLDEVNQRILGIESPWQHEPQAGPSGMASETREKGAPVAPWSS